MREPAEALFELLEVPAETAWQVRTTAVEVRGEPVALALDPTGRPSLLVPAPGEVPGPRLVTAGLRARVAELVDGDRSQVWLIVTSQASSLDRTFYRLCDDVLSSLEGRDGAAVAQAMAVVERWQRLMADTRSQLLSEEQCAGLLVELHVLEGLTAVMGWPDAMKSWVGHDHSRVDFRFAGAGIEAKATLRRERFKVTIHGLLQLDDVEIGSLYLFAQQLERVPTGGDSIPLALRRLVGRGVPETDLRHALADVGYASSDEDVYADLQFATLAERGVHIGSSTPRITQASFRETATVHAVSDVTYSIDLTDLTVEHGCLADASSVFERVAP